jgi:cytochrome c oxidase subunit 3
MSSRRAIDVSKLPTVVFGWRSLIWWGTIGMMMIEGTMFGIVLATYFYLRTRSIQWPPETFPPKLVYGTLNTIIFLLSAFPNQWIKKFAQRGDLGKVRVGLVVMTAIGLLNLLVRGFEFTTLNCRWDQNAYGSVVWTLLGLHAAHLITDLADTVVLAVLMFAGPIEGKRFMDVSENADYWYFVILTWLPIYLVLYFAPRLL